MKKLLKNIITSVVATTMVMSVMTTNVFAELGTGEKFIFIGGETSGGNEFSVEFTEYLGYKDNFVTVNVSQKPAEERNLRVFYFSEDAEVDFSGFEEGELAEIILGVTVTPELSGYDSYTQTTNGAGVISTYTPDFNHQLFIGRRGTDDRWYTLYDYGTNTYHSYAIAGKDFDTSQLTYVAGKDNTDTPIQINKPENSNTQEIKATVDGVEVKFDQKPIMKDGRTLVPMRAIFEAMGAEVEWNNDTQTITGTRGDIVVEMTLGNKVMTVNGENIKLDVAPQIINGRTVVPVRAVAESFDSNVKWDSSTNTVGIIQ